MSFLIGRGRYVRAAYPLPPAIASGGGFFKRIGFDNSVSNVTYNNDVGQFVPIARSSEGDPMLVALPGFTPGNLILMSFSVVGQDQFGSGPVDTNMTLKPYVNIGAGDQAVDTPSLRSLTAVVLQPITWISFVVPVAAEVTADPVVKVFIEIGGTDPCRINAFGALLMAAEVDASSPLVTQLPSTVLLPP